ncbi:MAG: M67 family metallopeptidase [Leptolyngbya sp.]|nr:M67 family metallopeptidase [Leptolyngbya sp.]
MTLHISQPQYLRIQEILNTAYPQEGCGVLVGKRVFEAAMDAQMGDSSSSQELYREVAQVIPVVNAWEPGLLAETGGGYDPPTTHGTHDRYWIDPADLLRIQRDARDQGLEIIGIMHSHPDHPAVPSECDRRLAWPVYSYVIASVCGGQVAQVHSWRLNDHQQFEPEAIKILDATTNNPPVLA